MCTYRPGPHDGFRRRLLPLLMAGAFALGATGCSGDEVENEDVVPVENPVAPVDPTVEPDE